MTPSRRLRAPLLMAIALAGCSGANATTTADGPRVRSVLEARLGLELVAAPKVLETPTLSNVRDVYSARTSSERILVVVFDSPAATRQILGKQPRLEGSEVLRRGNVAILYTVRSNSVSRTNTLKSALASAFERS